VRGGEVLGEFQTLVDPGMPIAPLVVVLTGITDRLVAGAPRLEAAVPAFLEFARGAVLVAHNAPYDTGFLRAACARAGVAWPDPQVLDTARLARHVVDADEVPNHKLATLAALFGSPVAPDHRALTDARATVHVLHALIERVGNLGVQSVEELAAYSARVPPETRRKRTLAADLPHAPGVYVFLDEGGRPLYVGRSVDIAARVRGYFTASERRTRMGEMVAMAAAVCPIVCATPLEASVRELRLIAEHTPPYNRRSRFPQRSRWVKLTVEPFPRLSVVHRVRPDGGAYIGPFAGAEQPELAVAALHETFRLRQCAGRLPRVPPPDARACLLADLGRCSAPCVGGTDVDAYARITEAARNAMSRDSREVVASLLVRARSLGAARRFEEAAVARDRLLAFLRASSRSQRLAPLAAAAELVAARRTERGGWELVLVRSGRLAGTAVSSPGADPRPVIDSLRATGEFVPPGSAVPPMPAALTEECEQVLAWLEQPGVRLVTLDGEWSAPLHGAVGARARLPPDLAAAGSAASSPGGELLDASSAPRGRRRRGRRR
jgi:DNA polymerase-3 subunit epsilon